MDETSAPFDEFGHTDQKIRTPRRGQWARLTQTALRAISFAALAGAISTAVLVVAVHAVRGFGGTPPRFLLSLKSAVPLIAIGISYVCLIFTIPRTGPQRVLGFIVGVTFALWGAEQFMKDPGWIACIDDFVMFVFVFDLSLVIRGYLKKTTARLPE